MDGWDSWSAVPVLSDQERMKEALAAARRASQRQSFALAQKNVDDDPTLDDGDY